MSKDLQKGFSEDFKNELMAIINKTTENKAIEEMMLSAIEKLDFEEIYYLLNNMMVREVYLECGADCDDTGWIRSVKSPYKKAMEHLESEEMKITGRQPIAE